MWVALVGLLMIGGGDPEIPVAQYGLFAKEGVSKKQLKWAQDTLLKVCQAGARAQSGREVQFKCVVIPLPEEL